jgi:APA family basic amino acid/polyamine antiporter
MAVDGELPGALKVRNRHGAPWLAESFIALAAVTLVQLEDLLWVIGFSSFSVLIYYSIGHLSSLRQPNSERIVPRWFSWLGLFLCVGLVSSIPGPAIPVSISILLAGLVAREILKRTVAKRTAGN